MNFSWKRVCDNNANDGDCSEIREYSLWVGEWMVAKSIWMVDKR